MKGKKTATKIKGDISKGRRRRLRDTTARKTIRGLSGTTLQHLERLWGMGISHGDSINAAMDLLMFHLTKNGQLWDDYRVKNNVLVQTDPAEDPYLALTRVRTMRYLQRQKELLDFVVDGIQDHLAKVREKKSTRTTRLTRSKGNRQARKRSHGLRRQRSEIVRPDSGRHKRAR